MGLIYSTNKNLYDWKPELPDFRDNIFKYEKINANKLPQTIDLRKKFKDYTKDYGSSSATCIAAVLDSYGLKYTYQPNNYNNNGNIRDTIKNFKIENEGKTLKYTKLCNFKNQLRQTLHEGYPIIFGFTVYESFESDNIKETGIIKNPKRDEKILGGLCGVIVGYDNTCEQWIVRNPINNGYIYISYDILAKNSNLSSDVWIITV